MYDTYFMIVLTLELSQFNTLSKIFSAYTMYCMYAHKHKYIFTCYFRGLAETQVKNHVCSQDFLAWLLIVMQILYVFFVVL